MRSRGKNDVSQVTEAIVLAGGLGTRLRSVVSDLPKPMASVAGRPFLCYLLEFLETQGIGRVILSVGYRHETISSFFSRQYGAILIDYAVEEEPLGTGGGIVHALEFAQEPFIFVLNGDTFLRLDYRAMARMIDNPGNLELAIALRKVPDAERYGSAVLSDNRIQRFSASGVDGSGLINAGVYLMARDLFQRYPVTGRFSFETDFLQKRAAEINPLAFVSDAPFIDIGVPESFEESQTLLPAWTGR